MIAANTDAVILGRKTYETVLGFGRDNWPYVDKPVVILSHQESQQFDLPPGARVLADLDGALDLIAERGWRDVWIDGASVIRSFIERRFVTELILTTIPLALGEGLSLFNGIKQELHMEIVASEVMGDVLATKYRIIYD
jgi:dihydrofolate reductase